MTIRQKIRIFVSSPADVRPERLITERLVQRLAREFAYHFIIEPVLWEREPLTAGAHFQDNIVPPRETDLVVCILWSRLGVTLPRDRFQGALTGGPVTGTEWEFEDALAGFQAVKRPDLLLYRKTAPQAADLDDDARLEEARRQRRLVEDFMTRWTRDAEGGFTAAFWEFAATGEFEDLVENHLRELLRRRLRGLTADGERVEGEVRWHQPPYRGLLSFEPEHAGVFFGRTRARNELRELLHRQATRGKAFVLVMGASGSGKSSLVKAGLLPDLKLPGMIGRVGLVRHLIVKPSEGGAEPLGALLAALGTTEALPELAALGLQAKADTLAETIRLGLEAASAKASLLAGAEARLLVVVDQLEELFTQERIGLEARDRFIAALEALATSGIVWVVATMRADFFDALAEAPRLATLSGGEARFLLLPPRDGEIGEIIRLPAFEAGLRFEARTETGEALDEVIRATAAAAPGALPLLSFLLDQMWQDRSAEGLLTFAAYERLGGLEGALARRAEAVFAALGPALQDAFPPLLRQLVTAGQGGHGQATSRPMARADLSRTPEAAGLIAALADARLLVVEGEMVRLAHEALITHWPRAAEQIALDRDDIERRARVESAAGTWERQARDGTLLLQKGLALSEAEDLLARRGAELPASLADFIALSSETARAAERRRLRRLRLTASVLAILAAGAGIGAWFGFTGQAEAERQAVIAENNAAEADRRRIDAQSATARALTEKARIALEAGATDRALALIAEALPAPGETPPRPLVPEAAAAAREIAAAEIVTGYIDFGEDGPGAIAVSPDGRTAFVGSAEGLLRLDLTRAAVAGVVTAAAGLGPLAFSPEGDRLLTQGSDTPLTLRTLDGAEVARFEGMTKVATAAYSPGGDVVAGDFEGRIAVWAPGGGAPRFTLQVEGDYIARLALPRPDRAFAATGKGVIVAFDPQAGRELWRTPVLEGDEPRLAASADGRHVALAAYSAGLAVVDGETGAVVARRPDAVATGGLLFRRVGGGLLAFGRDATTWGAGNGFELQATMPMGMLDMTALALDEASGIAVALSHERGVEIWNLDLEQRLLRADLGGTDGVWDRVVTGGRRAVAISRDGRLAVLDLSGLLPETVIDHSTAVAFGAGAEYVGTAAATGDGKTIYALFRNGQLRPVDVAGASLGPALPDVAKDLYFVTTDGSGRQLAALDLEKQRIDLIAGTPGAAAGSFTIPDPDYGRARRLESLALSPDGRFLAVIWPDGGALIDIAKEAGVADFKLRNVLGNVAAFSADGSLLAIAQGDGTLALFDGRTGAAKGLIHGTPENAMSVAVSPDGRSALLGTSTGEVATVDLARGIAGQKLRIAPPTDASPPIDFVAHVAYADGGRLALADSRRGGVVLFDPAGGAILARRPAGGVGAFAFDPVRRRIAVVPGNLGGTAGARLRWYDMPALALAPGADGLALTRSLGRRGLSGAERIDAFLDAPPAPADPAADPVRLCDQGAADPFDPGKQAPGVALPDQPPLFPAPGVEDPVARACAEAARMQPAEARFPYQEARALYRSGARDRALARLDVAASAGYAPALVLRAAFHAEARAPEKAQALLDQAFGLGSAAAALALAEGAGDPVKAAPLWQAASARGDGRGDYALGIQAEAASGGAPEGLAQALRHYLVAAQRLAALGPGAAAERDKAMAARGRLVAALIAQGPAGLQKALEAIRAAEGPGQG
ncbi:AAA family ATPase [Zavarzinia compransoris]|uniref:Orc1-like AAA ATPase domain-containing protein n=1 Tax=Zavarzinia compransoris TaxID=1264899 RepID=A0A317EDL1_9PROT|nr:AAA family ATPase [Zavarzinia compransoris]PWR23443.1 hypothetical protein DKG75_02410 [Zavarzinia compransoris]TDP45979.1 WD40 repeat protein [Zavarzinia compransoris]